MNGLHKGDSVTLSFINNKTISILQGRLELISSVMGKVK